MSRYAPLSLLLVLPLVVAPGCGSAAPQAAFKTAADAAPPAAPAPAGKPAADAPAEPAVARRIIYNATVEVVVKSLDEVSGRVERLTTEAGGYVAKSDIAGNTGSRRTATWVLKIPAAKFRTAVQSLTAIGIPIRNVSDSQDVTEEFIDLQARVKNLKAEEEALNALLKAAPNMEGMLKVRAELKTIRGDIERAEGRQKYLANMSDMSTVTFTAREEENYVPPAAPELPTFGTEINQTFNASVDAMKRVGRSITLFVVAIGPWLPFIAIGALLFRWGILRLTAAIDAPTPPRRSRPAPAPPAADPTPAPSADRPE